MQKVKVGLIQHECTSNKNANIEKTIGFIKQMAQQGAQVICLQELFSTQYFCYIEEHKYFDLAEPLNGPTIQLMQQLANKYGIVLIVPIFEYRAPGIYHNSVVVIDSDGNMLGFYRKQHIPDDPGFYEKYYFTPGDRGYKVFETKFGKIAVLICWDQWFPEAARIVSLMGAQIIFYPTAIGWDLTSSDSVNKEQFIAWQTIQRAHAIANGLYVVAVNRVGTESVTKFWGGSFIANPFGSILYEASNNSETIHIEELDLSAITYYRTIWPFFRDRRIDTYNPILKRYIDE